MNFIRKHFKGEYPLGMTFGFIFLGLTAAYHFLEPLVRRPFADYPVVYTSITIAYLVVTRLIIYPWQIIGLVRCLEKYHTKNDNSFLLYSIQIVVVASLAWTISHIITATQILVQYKQDVAFHSAITKQVYSLALGGNGKLLHIEGSMDFGITRKTAEILAANSAIRGVVLDSDGGQIYEGRGLAVLFDKNNLDTYTYKGCSSACATAFIGGKNRYLGPDAALGFHRYKFDPQRSRQVSPTYDLEVEEQKDLALFRSKDIKAAFLEKAFQSAEMWYPSPEELLASGVAHGIVNAIDLQDEALIFEKLVRVE